MNKYISLDEELPSIPTKTIPQKIREVFENNSLTINSIEHINQYNIYKILVNTTDLIKCKKIFKRRFEEKPDFEYEYNGYVFEATPELKKQITESNLIYISCYDINDKLCFIIGEKETGIFTKIIRSYKYHHLPCELKWKVTNITRYTYSRVMNYEHGEVIM